MFLHDEWLWGSVSEGVWRERCIAEVCNPVGNVHQQRQAEVHAFPPHSTVASSKVVHIVVIEREFSFICIINSALYEKFIWHLFCMFYFATSDIMEAKLTVALRAIAAGAVAIFAKGAAVIKATGGAKVGMATAAMTAATTAAVAGSKTEHK